MDGKHDYSEIYNNLCYHRENALQFYHREDIVFLVSSLSYNES